MLHSVAVGRTDVSEELSASIIRMTRNFELGTTLAVTNNDARYEEIQSHRRESLISYITININRYVRSIQLPQSGVSL
jgi:hypothetical protein